MRTPYYAGTHATLYLGDCRETFASLRPLDAGLLATDPPYGQNWQSGRRADTFDRIDGDDGSVDWPTILGAIVRRHLRNRRHAYVFGYPPEDLAEPLRLGGTAVLVWDKMLVSGGDLTLPWGPGHEPITFGVYGQSPAQRGQDGGGRLAARLRRGSVLRHRRPSGSSVRRHPTEKPVPLMRELIESSTVFGDLVIDPCAGVGSTGVAAVLEGRRFVGAEQDEHFADVAAQRLAAAEAIVDKVATI